MSSARTDRGRLLRVVACSALVVATVTGAALAQQVRSPYETALHEMLAAIQANSYERFMALADARFRDGYTAKMFEEANQKLGQRLAKGYTDAYLTRLRQSEYAVYVWKVEFKDGGDDLLLTLFVKDRKISGFWTR